MHITFINLLVVVYSCEIIDIQTKCSYREVRFFLTIEDDKSFPFLSFHYFFSLLISIILIVYQNLKLSFAVKQNNYKDEHGD